MTVVSDVDPEQLPLYSSAVTKRNCERTLYRWLATICPCLVWLKSYRVKEYLKMDIIAGITAGTMLVPQGMSYAKLAGLPPIYGLYSGFAPILAYAVFGSSRQLAIGPVALVSLLVANGLRPIVDKETILDNEAGAALYVQLAILLALMVGVIETTMGLARLGWLIRFVSHSVISGFTSGSAIIIALSQAKSFLGYEVSHSSELIPIMRSIFAGFDKFLWQPFVMGCVVLPLLLVMKHLGKLDRGFRYLRVAGPLTGLVLSTVFVKVFRPASISVGGVFMAGGLHSSGVTTSILPLQESLGIATALATKNGYNLNSNRELFGLGVANLVGSVFSAYPTAGSFSRSAVNNDSGAKSGISAIITALFVGSALLFLTPLFSDIPQCTLGAIVISAVMGLVDYKECIFLWRVDKKDFLSWLAASVITLFCGVEYGVLLSVLLSLLFVIYESANPHIVVLGRLPGTTVYRNVSQYTDAYIYHGIVVIRIDAPIYFANIGHIKGRLPGLEEISAQAANRGVEGVNIQYVILEMSPVTYVDSAALHAIKELSDKYKSRHIQLALANVNPKVMACLTKAGIPELIGSDWLFLRVHDGVQVCNAAIEERQSSLSRLGNLN